MGEIHIASLNVNGARNCVKRMEIYEMMKQRPLDDLSYKKRIVMRKLLQTGQKNGMV